MYPSYSFIRNVSIWVLYCSPSYCIYQYRTSYHYIFLECEAPQAALFMHKHNLCIFFFNISVQECLCKSTFLKITNIFKVPQLVQQPLECLQSVLNNKMQINETALNTQSNSLRNKTLQCEAHYYRQHGVITSCHLTQQSQHGVAELMCQRGILMKGQGPASSQTFGSFLSILLYILCIGTIMCALWFD